MRILITGGSGMLGIDLRRTLASFGHEIVFTSSSAEDGPDSFRLDITDYDSVLTRFRQFSPELVIHAAAYTHVEGCERDEAKAFQVNAFGTWSVASAAESIGASLVVVSTDFVFDGGVSRSYTEFDATNPLNVYGSSKLEGEKLALQSCRKTYVVRTSWLFGVHGKNFVYTMINQAAGEKKLAVVADQTGCPTFTVDLAQSILKIVQRPLYGVYHSCNTGATTWYEFARAILDRSGYSGYPIEPLSTEEAAQRFQIKTKRPGNSALQCRVLELLGEPQPRPWSEALEDFISKATVEGKL